MHFLLFLPIEVRNFTVYWRRRSWSRYSRSWLDNSVRICHTVTLSLQILFRFDPPDEPREYIHRVGRTARGETGTGHALLILRLDFPQWFSVSIWTICFRPEELGFLRFLKAAKVTLNEYEFSWNKIANIQPQLEKLISQNYYLNKSAKEAYK